MFMDRRTFVAATSAAVTSAARHRQAHPSLRPPIKAVLFDAFPVFDPRPVAALVTRLFPEQGQALVAAWRTRQFEYTWLRTCGGQYRDFWTTTRQALAAAAASLQVSISTAQQSMLMDSFLQLKAWPDVPDAIAGLKSTGIRVGFLSNFTAEMLEANLRSAGLQGQFDYVLSTDRARHFKPAPEAYQLGVTATGLAKEQIVFAAFAGWDAAGAKWFGYPTVWVNRLQAPPEELDATPDQTGPDLRAVLSFVTATG
jgi:2-haloacid dehalogenase